MAPAHTQAAHSPTTRSSNGRTVPDGQLLDRLQVLLNLTGVVPEVHTLRAQRQTHATRATQRSRAQPPRACSTACWQNRNRGLREVEGVRDNNGPVLGWSKPTVPSRGSHQETPVTPRRYHNATHHHTPPHLFQRLLHNLILLEPPQVLVDFVEVDFIRGEVQVAQVQLELRKGPKRWRTKGEARTTTAGRGTTRASRQSNTTTGGTHDVECPLLHTTHSRIVC